MLHIRASPLSASISSIYLWLQFSSFVSVLNADLFTIVCSVLNADLFTIVCSVLNADLFTIVYLSTSLLISGCSFHLSVSVLNAKMLK